MQLFLSFTLSVLICMLSVSAFSVRNDTASALSLKALSGRWLSLNSPKNADGTSYYKNASCYSASYQYLDATTLLVIEQFNFGSATGPLAFGDWGFLINLLPTGGLNDFNLTFINQFPHFVAWQNVSLVGPLNTAGIYTWAVMEWPSEGGANSWSLFVRDLAHFQNGNHASELQQIANFKNLNVSSVINPSEFEGCNFTQSLWEIKVD
jgi:hypothetical protein